MTQAELAGELNVSQNTVSNWATGRFRPSAARIGPLAKALNTSPSALFGYEDTVSTAPGTPTHAEADALIARIAALEPQVRSMAEATPDLLEVLDAVRRRLRDGSQEQTDR